MRAIVTGEDSKTSKADDDIKAKFHEVKGKTKDELGKLMNDPTLEGKDANRVGRVQRKTRQVENRLEK